MNKITRLLILLVVIAMLVGCLASCDIVNSLTGNDTTDTTDTTDNNNDANPDDKPGDSAGNNGGDNTGDNTGNNGGNTGNNGGNTGNNGGNTEIEFVDYASQVKFDPNSGRAYAKVKVKSYIDGDTTHFVTTDGTVIGDLDLDYIKARYLAINTPESTGVIEPWGKKASNYTKEQLKNATSIIIESDSATWDLDSTGGRYLLWVWYKTAEDTDYRNLNLEILQQGLAYGSNVLSNVYGETASEILAQAKALKLHVFSKERDPDFYYDGAIELTLKELKANCEKYEGKLVKFEAVVAKQVGPTIYVEEYDATNDMYFGMQIYAGYGYPKMNEFAIGNRVSIVGTLQYYDNGGTYQVANLQYEVFDPNWEGGCRVIGTGYSSSYNEVKVDTIMNGKIVLDTYKEILDENGEVIDETLVKENFNYGDLAHYSTATIKNLTVKDTYTTKTGDSKGAITITCVSEEGITFDVRTASLLTREVDGVKVDVVEADFPVGTVISVIGVLDSFNGVYQIKVFNINDITFEN